MIHLAALESEHDEVISKVVARLVEKLVVPELGECWEWTGALSAGYGNLRYRKIHWKTNRFVYQHCVAKIPDRLWVLHRCDNRKCSRPAHLFLGTSQDNIRDMHRKGRNNKWWLLPNPTQAKKGEHNAAAKLSDAQADMIRRRVAGGEKQCAVAADVGVSSSLVSMIVNRKIRT